MRYTWTPLDVGFDVRHRGTAIVIPKDCTEAIYDYSGEERTVCGDRATIAAAMKDAGYNISPNFKVGDGASYNIGSDSYPVTIRKISKSGKTLWVSRDDFRCKPGVNRYEQTDKEGVFIPLDVPESEWERYTLRQDGHWRPSKSGCGYLSEGRTLSLDPSF